MHQNQRRSRARAQIAHARAIQIYPAFFYAVIRAGKSSPCRFPVCWHRMQIFFAPLLRPDNFFLTAGVYLSEHRLCSLHLGSFGSPFFSRTVTLSFFFVPERSRWIALRLHHCRPGKELLSNLSPNLFVYPNRKPPHANSDPRRDALQLPDAASRKPPSRCHLPLLPQQFLQHPDPLIHMLLLQ